ncbi:hypothetical protein HCN44_002748 [Aphidius gifuensis]|uniref:F-box domain-containing protein n=1 Tax=Aphidius gifuensis TaxID=684658 RepID=A0A834XUU0_APHGI|nr:F-box only protein 39-like [Aphidius gifuensis]KAF7991186.1 hypothetical protein HCN44_002748 [Aphidius gifuensis]
MWSQLPELILTNIFHYLDCEDRCNVGKTCQSWNHALASPILWRCVTILIDRDLRSGFPLATEIAIKYGQHMRSLEMAWSRPYINPREFRLSSNIRAKEGLDFIEILKNKNIQIKEFILTNWFFSTNWNNRSKLLAAIAIFIRCQENLLTLSLLNAYLGVSDVLRLLRAVANSSGYHLKTLDIRGAFRDWQAPHTNSRYLRYLGRMHALNTLHLDYPALSDQVLYALANGASKTLKNFNISIRDSDVRQHTVGDSAWSNLAIDCPDLKVSYTIVNISHYDDMSYLLLPSVPLSRFEMYGGHVWDQSRSRNFRSTVGLLITHYTNTLEEVILQLRYNRELLDDLLVSMLQKCKQLTRLQYDGIIQNLGVLNDIIKLQTLCKTKFSKIHVKPKNVNTRNRQILTDITYQYNQKLYDQRVDFRIEDPTSSLLFYY